MGGKPSSIGPSLGSLIFFVAITIVNRMAFPKCPRTMCWAHVIRNMDKKLLGVTNMDRRNRFMRDIFVLHLATILMEFKDV